MLINEDKYASLAEYVYDKIYVATDKGYSAVAFSTSSFISYVNNYNTVNEVKEDAFKTIFNSGLQDYLLDNLSTYQYLLKVKQEATIIEITWQ